MLLITKCSVVYVQITAEIRFEISSAKLLPFLLISFMSAE